MKKHIRAILRTLVILTLFAGLSAVSAAVPRPDPSDGKRLPLA